MSGGLATIFSQLGNIVAVCPKCYVIFYLIGEPSVPQGKATEVSR
jgi:hypothetical protein